MQKYMRVCTHTSTATKMVWPEKGSDEVKLSWACT